MNSSKIIGYTAHFPPNEVYVIDDSLVVFGSEGALRLRLSQEKSKPFTVRKFRFGDAMATLKDYLPVSFDELAYSRFSPLGLEEGVPVMDQADMQSFPGGDRLVTIRPEPENCSTVIDGANEGPALIITGAKETSKGYKEELSAPSPVLTQDEMDSMKRQLTTKREVDFEAKEFGFGGVTIYQIQNAHLVVDSYKEAEQEMTFPDSDHNLSAEIFRLPYGLIMCGLVQRDEENGTAHTTSVLDLSGMSGAETRFTEKEVAEILLEYCEFLTFEEGGKECAFYCEAETIASEHFLMEIDPFIGEEFTPVSKYLMSFSSEQEYAPFEDSMEMEYDLFCATSKLFQRMLKCDGVEFNIHQFDNKDFSKWLLNYDQFHWEHWGQSNTIDDWDHRLRDYYHFLEYGLVSEDQ